MCVKYFDFIYVSVVNGFVLVILVLCSLQLLCKVSSLSLFLPVKSGPEVIKLFSCSTQLSIKLFLLINVEMQTIVQLLAFHPL